MRMLFCVLLAFVATISCSLNVIGGDDASGTGLQAFLETSNTHSEGARDWMKRMSVPLDFPKKFGNRNMADDAKFTRAQVEKLCEGTDLMEFLNLPVQDFYNASVVKQIVVLRQDEAHVDAMYERIVEKAARQARNNNGNPNRPEDGDDDYHKSPANGLFNQNGGQKICYCHLVGADDDDEDSDGGEDFGEDTTGEEGEEEGGEGGTDAEAGVDTEPIDTEPIDTEPIDTEPIDTEEIPFGTAFYAALWVGGPKVIVDQFDESYEKSTGNDPAGEVVFNPGHEYSNSSTRICPELTGVGHEVIINNNVFFPCHDCCEYAMTHGDATLENNPKFWGSGGCPVVSDDESSCEIPVLEAAHQSFHFHLRNLESLKMFSVLTQSRDTSAFCNNYERSLPKKRTDGYLLDRSCEEQVAAYEVLSKGDLEFMNAHDVAVRACRMDGKCTAEIDMKAAWYHMSGDDCASCMAPAYAAAMDYDSLSRNKMDTEHFCTLQKTVHPYFNDMSDSECKSIVSRYHDNSGAVMRTAVDYCGSQCTFQSTHKFDTKFGNQKDTSLVSEISDPIFWDKIEL